MSASLTRQRHVQLGYLRPQWPQVALLLLRGIGLELLATSDEMRRLTAGDFGTVEEYPTEAS